jgi:hypothetical protein
MSNNNWYVKSTDEILKMYEDSNKLKNISSIASNLMATLTGKSENDIIRAEIKIQIPKLKDNLLEHLSFYKNKKEENGNIPNLEKEISKCDSILENLINVKDIDELRDLLKWVNTVKIKYGFQHY